MQTYIKTRAFLAKLRGTDAEVVMMPLLEGAPEVLSVDWLMETALKTSAYFRVKAIVTDLLSGNYKNAIVQRGNNHKGEVYVVIGGLRGDQRVIAVYAARNKADARCRAENEQGQDTRTHVEVWEVE